MKRPDIEEYEKNIEEQPFGFHVNGEVSILIEYIKELEAQDRRRDWPTQLHEQYLVVLDERDALQEQIDVYQRILDDMPTDDLFEIYREEMFGNDDND